MPKNVVFREYCCLKTTNKSGIESRVCGQWHSIPSSIIRRWFKVERPLFVAEGHKDLLELDIKEITGYMRKRAVLVLLERQNNTVVNHGLASTPHLDVELHATPSIYSCMMDMDEYYIVLIFIFYFYSYTTKISGPQADLLRYKHSVGPIWKVSSAAYASSSIYRLTIPEEMVKLVDSGVHCLLPTLNLEGVNKLTQAKGAAMPISWSHYYMEIQISTWFHLPTCFNQNCLFITLENEQRWY